MMSFKKRFEIRNNSCKILDIIVSYSDDSDVVVISLTTNNDNTVVANKAKDVLGNPIYNDFIIYRL